MPSVTHERAAALVTALSLLATADALAAEVVWLDDAPSTVQEDVALQAGARRGPLSPIDLRAAATDAGAADDAAYESLASVLRASRAYETRLDGELVIMRDLDRPLDAIGIIRSTADRDAIFAALAYQGFAVDRFFDTDLADDERAAPYRVDLNGVAVVRPWADAVALAPERDVSPYEIAEAPQRIAYGRTAKMLRTELLPATLVVGEPTERTTVMVDGVPVTPDAGGAVKVVPGRHWVHLVRNDHVIARWTVRVGAAEERALAPALDDATWKAWLADARAGKVTTVPESLRPSIEALGGEVWLAEPGPKGATTLTVLKADGSVTSRTASAARARGGTSKADDDKLLGWSVAVGAEGSWLYSGDFYTQDPLTVTRDKAAVNAGALTVDVHAALEVSLARIGVGLDLTTPFGADHVALTGDGGLRPRPYVYGAVGVRWVQLTGGYVFPYHPAAGAMVTVPVFEGLEVRASGYAGFPTSLTRADGSTYDTNWLTRLGVGLAWRFGG
ncbi:MAG: hypothetical protein H6733_03475 [Alphaproteobacteria bacterium]|nr:hypothetical protein [Alphaproteobacteria bacterium]